MDKPETISFHRRNLPHWRVWNRAYFVTINLKGAIPAKVINRYKLGYDKFLKTHPDEKCLIDYQRRHFQRIEKLLDSSDVIGSLKAAWF